MKLMRPAWFALVLMFCVAIVSAQAASAQSTPLTITIHLAECPAGYAGADPFTDCHGDALAGVTFDWPVAAPGAPESVTTAGNGVAVIETTTSVIGLGLSIIEYPPFELASYSVYCSTDDGATAVPVNYRSGSIGIAFPTSADIGDGNLVCDWYNVPVGDGDDGGSDEPVTLPSTGVSLMSGGTSNELWLAFALAAMSAGGMAIGLRCRSVR